MKILASDFDNTIYFPHDEELTNKNIEAINKFVKAGNIFCIVTGRNYTDLKLTMNNYNIPYSYLLCEDGAKIFNNVDYCLNTILLNRKDIEKAIPLLEENNCDYYLDDGYNQSSNYDDCVKIVIKCPDMEERERLTKIVREQLHLHVYASREHVNIINKVVDKENALKTLFNLESLDYDLLRVIGDNDNDYEMLNAFEGATVKEHHPKLDELDIKVYDTLSDYIEELMKN